MLYSDHGSEYDGMDTVLRELGIVHEASAPYTPEQNCTSERLNRSLMEMTRSMLDQAGLPPTFSGEAVVTATALRNLTGSSGTGTETSVGILTGRKPDVLHLRVFGSEAWIHVPKQLRKKLHPKAKRAIVLRSLSHGKYRIWDINAKRAYDTRHAVVNEIIFPAREWRSRDANSEAIQMWYRDLYPTLESLTDGSSDSSTEGSVGAGMTVYGPDDDEGSNLDPSNVPYLVEMEPDAGETGIDEEEMPELDPVTYTPTMPSTFGQERRYPERERNPVSRFGHTANTAQEYHEALPASIEEALQGTDAVEWKKAIESELAALHASGTWDMTSAPPDAKIMDTKFIFTKKFRVDGTIERYKARLVVKGFQQGNADSVYAPVIDFTTIRVALAGTVHRDGVVHHLDVKTAFLNGKLESDETVFVKPPPGIDLGLKHGQTLRLNRALYGLMRAPRIWNRTWTAAVTSLGYEQLKSDECVYLRRHQRGTVLVLLYVDDVLVVAPDDEVARQVKKEIMKLFEMRDLGWASKFLGVEFVHNPSGIFLHQRTYADEILKRFEMYNCKKKYRLQVRRAVISSRRERRSSMSSNMSNIRRSSDPFCFYRLVQDQILQKRLGNFLEKRIVQQKQVGLESSACFGTYEERRILEFCFDQVNMTASS